MMGDYRPPTISAESTTFLTSSNSAWVSSMCAAAEFSSKRETLLVPGIGMIYLGYKIEQGKYIVTLSQEPGERKLSGSTTLLLRNFI